MGGEVEKLGYNLFLDLCQVKLSRLRATDGKFPLKVFTKQKEPQGVFRKA